MPPPGPNPSSPNPSDPNSSGPNPPRPVRDRPARLAAEIAEIPEAVARLGPDAVAAAVDVLATADPPFLVTIARGSSDHAALYLKYAIELLTGRPVASLGPSVASVYGRELHLDGAVALALSQSGASEDLALATARAREGGARAIGLLNTPDSPLAGACDAVVDVRAGREMAVAATKSVACTIVAGLHLLAAWRRDDDLARALATLPDRFQNALDADVDPLVEALAGADGGTLFMIGRGPAYALAVEAALKCMEVPRVPALAYSGAEVLHGPAALVGPGTTIVSFGGDATPGMGQAHERLRAQGARLIAMDEIAPVVAPVGRNADPLTSPLPWLAAFYRAAERAARLRGMDPDDPPNLRKETVTR